MRARNGRVAKQSVLQNAVAIQNRVVVIRVSSNYLYIAITGQGVCTICPGISLVQGSYGLEGGPRRATGEKEEQVYGGWEYVAS